MTEDKKRKVTDVNRRKFLQNTSIAGIGIVGYGSTNSDAISVDQNIQFVMGGFDHIIRESEDELKNCIDITMDMPREHSVSPDGKQITFTQFTHSSTKTTFNMNNKIFYDTTPNSSTYLGYTATPTTVVHEPSQNFVTKLASYYPIEGFISTKSTTTPKYDIEYDQEAVLVSIEGQQHEILPGDEAVIELSEKSVAIQSDTNTVGEYSSKQVTAIPRLQIQNYGQLKLAGIN
ncbi:hypothetical protein [Haladaptatus sp. DFWS20]|uniref:hypothetical protein n=1 Tax=Haladaptatus sp. DFWS20 TaxID=3403467 RepID=UPI003EBAE8D0